MSRPPETAVLVPLFWTVTCSECGYEGRVPGRYRGHHVRCKTCGTGFKVSARNARPGNVAVAVVEGSLAATDETPTVSVPTPGPG